MCPPRRWRSALVALLVGCLTMSIAAAPAAGSARETSLEYDGDRLTVVPLADQPVGGTTDLDPGTNLSVELRTADGAFLQEARATVTEAGTFTARLDFGNLRPNATFRVVVIGPDRERLATAEGVVEPLSGTDTTVEYDGDLLTVEAAPNRTLAGTTDLPAGTTLTIRVRSAGGTPFLKQATATVDDAGRFATTVDFSGIEPGSSFTVTVVETGTRVDGVVDGPGVGVPPETEPALTRSIVRLAPPGTVSWNVSVNDSEPFFAVGEGDAAQVVRLVDADGDGEVTVIVDGTDADAAPRLRVAAPDRYEVVQKGSLRPLSAADQYDVRLLTAVGGEAVDIGTLAVDGATTETSTPISSSSPPPSFLERNAVGIAGVVAVLFGLLALGRARR